MHDEIREIHEYCIRLTDAVRNYAHNRRNPARQILNDWWNHKSMVCPQPDTLTNENLDQFLSDDPSRRLQSEFPDVAVSSVHEFVSNHLEAEMIRANGIEDLTQFIGKLDRLRLADRLTVEFKDTADPWQGWKQMAEYAADLGIATKTLQRTLPPLTDRGLAARQTPRGKINLRLSATKELNRP